MSLNVLQRNLLKLKPFMSKYCNNYCNNGVAFLSSLPSRASMSSISSPAFNYKDPLNLEILLTEEEIMTRFNKKFPISIPNPI